MLTRSIVISELSVNDFIKRFCPNFYCISVFFFRCSGSCFLSCYQYQSPHLFDVLSHRRNWKSATMKRYNRFSGFCAFIHCCPKALSGHCQVWMQCNRWTSMPRSTLFLDRCVRMCLYKSFQRVQAMTNATCYPLFCVRPSRLHLSTPLPPGIGSSAFSRGV